MNVMDQSCFERHSLGADEVINKVVKLLIRCVDCVYIKLTVGVYHSQTVFDSVWKQFARHSFSLFVGIRLSPQTSKTMTEIIGSLQLAIQVVQYRHAGEQETHLDKTKKEL